MNGPITELNATHLSGLWGGLRPLEVERDAGRIYAQTHGAEIEPTWVEMKVGPFPTEADFAAHVAELVSDRKRAFFAVVGPDDEAQGWLCLMEASAAHKGIELGYVLYAPSLQRTTLATEAFYLAMAYVFDTLGYQRLEWTCTVQNMRSRRAADRLGFTFEGVMRSKFILKGVTRDIAMYSLLAEEWKEQRNAMRDWLDPANFENGVQRRPLALRGRNNSSAGI
jgi:RimJ/RimL family protein N-acetyltransferase